MTDHEWDDFWRVLDAKRQRLAEDDASASVHAYSEDDELLPEEEELAQSLTTPLLEPRPEPAVAADPPPKGKAGRVNRCGACSACRSKDCGTCKNCLDKPRYGGPGVKKKACISRVCKNTQTAARDDESDAESTPTSSPALRSCALSAGHAACPAAALPPPLYLPDRFPSRQPLLPIDTQPPAASMPLLLPLPAQQQRQQPPLAQQQQQHAPSRHPLPQHVQLGLLPRPPSVTRAH